MNSELESRLDLRRLTVKLNYPYVIFHVGFCMFCLCSFRKNLGYGYIIEKTLFK